MKTKERVFGVKRIPQKTNYINKDWSDASTNRRHKSNQGGFYEKCMRLKLHFLRPKLWNVIRRIDSGTRYCERALRKTCHVFTRRCLSFFLDNLRMFTRHRVFKSTQTSLELNIFTVQWKQLNNKSFLYQILLQ